MSTRHPAPRWNGAVKTKLLHFHEDVGEQETLQAVTRKIRSRMKLASYKDGSLDFRWLFSKYDLNRSGLISLDELRMAIRKELKIPPASLSEIELGIFYDSLDTDASGMLDIEEICTFLEEGLQKPKPTLEEEEASMLRLRRNLKVARITNRCGSWKKVFERYDMDDDSTMSIYELERAVRTELNLTPWEVSKDDLKSLFAEMDQDRSKTLTVDEVCTFMNKKESGALGKVSHLFNKRSIGIKERAKRPSTSLGSTDLRPHSHHLRRRPFPLLADCAPRSLGLRGSASTPSLGGGEASKRHSSPRLERRVTTASGSPVSATTPSAPLQHQTSGNAVRAGTAPGGARLDPLDRSAGAGRSLKLSACFQGAGRYDAPSSRTGASWVTNERPIHDALYRRGRW